MNFQELLEKSKKDRPTYEKAYQDYLSNPKKCLGVMKATDNLGNKIVYNVVKFEFHTDNEPYKLFRQGCYNFLSECPEYKDYIDIQEEFISSVVEISPNKDLMREHNRMRIETSFGHFCVASYKNGLELTRIMVKGQLGKGQGTRLMDLFMALMIKGGIDLETTPIMLECVGAVGGGSNRKESTITLQTKFFRKFGFRVDQNLSNYKNNYVQMWFKNELFSQYKKTFGGSK
jgi:hypothetical protein